MNETLIPKGVSADMLPAICHSFGGGVYAKETRIPSGMILIQHRHKYDHLAILASGSVVLDVNGVHIPLTGPQCVLIEAGKHHGVKALTDVVWYCVHASDVADDDALIGESPDSDGLSHIVNRLQGA
jgi:hypothetical protein